MKKIVFVMLLSAIIPFMAFCKTPQTRTVKKDTVRDLRNQPKPRAIKNHKQRVKMQLHQIKVHKKQLEKYHKADSELEKHQPRSH